MTKAIAYGRVGLLGNPSDIYGGKCISFTFDRKAEVEIEEHQGLKIEGNGVVEKNLHYNGSHNLIKATLKQLNLIDKNILIRYKTDIPFGAGLSGSSAIVIATIKALKEYFDLNLDNYELAERALRVETEELNIAAGFQDRYIISFGGLAYMNFTGKEFMRKNDPYGKIELLDVKEIPCFIALSGIPKTSAMVHNPLRERFLNGDEKIRKEIKNKMDEIAELADKGKKLILRQDWKKVGELMNKNTELRNKISEPIETDQKMINEALNCGALGAKVAGSGGSIVVLSEDEEVFEKMRRKYECFKPKITIY